MAQRVNMDLLTYRLANLAKEIEQKQLVVLVLNENLQRKRVIKRHHISGMLPSVCNDESSSPMESFDVNTWKKMVSLRSTEEENRMNKETREKQKKLDEFSSAMKPSNPTIWKKAISLRKREKENNMNKEEREKQKKLGTPMLWNASRNNSETENPESTHDKSKVLDGSKNKFLKASKMAVVIGKVKQGQDICTCRSLGAECKVHDV